MAVDALAADETPVCLQRGFSTTLPGPLFDGSGIRELGVQGHVACQVTPVLRWSVESAPGSRAAAAGYGGFVSNGAISTDAGAFCTSALEAQALDPQMTLIMESSYAALHDAMSA